ncbi:MFS transporter [Phototrophicus methaneseepsis]|uniref:MFS transporter n=1 Tax=Phototrophicus methaneseepsis TaxID=2710758 RepID=A0A7S8ED31_9CHLR|nr:MFS transporter [Phototrophicus methaneseepsis]QPC84716.1 MFS transporter [Phototrophicus methaneseepsis]
MASQLTLSFHRDRFTWLAYGSLGFYAFLQAAIGPTLPYLREELGLNYTIGGLHITLFAAGIILASLTSAELAQRIGRNRLFWGGSLGMSFGALLFISAQAAILTLLGSFLMGYLGSYVLVMVQSTLSDRHQQYRTIALTESQITASGLATLSPLVLALGASTFLSWRLVYAIGIVLCFLLFITNITTPIPPSKPRKRKKAPQYTADTIVSTATDDEEATLPRIFWLIWLVIGIGVAVEWSIVAWTADYLANAHHLPQEQASGMVSVFLAAMVTGRFIGSRLTRHMRSENVLWIAAGLTSIGFIVLILASGGILPILGLLICGLGVANLFPMGQAIASEIGAELSDITSGYVSLASGCAMLIAPQILGALADVIGIESAFQMIIVLLIGYVLMYSIAQYLRR